MPTKEELAQSGRVDELKQLAADHEIDLGDATRKDDIVAAIVASKKVSKDELATALGPDESSEGDAPSEPSTDGEENTAPVEPAPGHQGPEEETPGAPASPAGSGAGPGQLENSNTGLVTEEDAAARVEGRTSDAASRIEGNLASETPRDITDGPKPSDAGAEDYPFPTQGDVDVATIPDASKKAQKAEYMEPLDGGDVWVRLGTGEDVPEELRGHIGYILDAPTMIHPTEGVRVADPDKPIVVRTRDEHDARVQVSMDDIEAISRNGRAGLTSFA